MRFAGIDVGAERHMLAMVGEKGEVLCRSSPFGGDESGYGHLFEMIGAPEGWAAPAISIKRSLSRPGPATPAWTTKIPDSRNAPPRPCLVRLRWLPQTLR
jgi:hypothetical protein